LSPRHCARESQSSRTVGIRNRAQIIVYNKRGARRVDFCLIMDIIH
ncbi:unnamed protein product, partial [Callosobruchus maculatus]